MITKARLELSVRFMFRAPKKNRQVESVKQEGIRTLYITLRVNGKTCRSRYSSGVRIKPEQWNQSTQLITGRSPLTQKLNERLAAIKAEHQGILNRLISAGITPSVERVKREWVKGPCTAPYLVQLYSLYLDHLDSLSGTEEAKATRTLEKWYYGRTHLKTFIKAQTGQVDIEISEVNVAWGRRYHTWLLKQYAHQSDTATKYVSFVRAVLDHGVELGHLEFNPLETLRFKRRKPKQVYFLEDQHLSRLEALSLEGTANLARDWALLVCYTGLDYPDLVTFLKAPKSYLLATMSGQQKIKLDRSKTRLECQIPALPQVLDLLARYKYQVPWMHAATINRFLKVFEPLIGFVAGKITLKICRKTAGALFLNSGYSIEVVQKILGHASVSTTQRYYVHVIDKRVDREMMQVGLPRLSVSYSIAKTA